MKHFLGTFVFIALITLGSAHCFFGIRFLPRNNNFECEPGVYKFKDYKLCICSDSGKWACGQKIDSVVEISDEFSYKCTQQQIDYYEICFKTSRLCEVYRAFSQVFKCFAEGDENISDEIDFKPTPEVPPKTTKKPETTTNPPIQPTTEAEASGDSFNEADLEKDDFKCKPNKSFKLACNTCWCRSDGKGPKYCTRIACNPKTYKPLSQQETDFLDTTTEPMN